MEEGLIRIDYQPTAIETVDTDGRGIARFTAVAIKEGPLPYRKVERPPMPEHGLGNLPDVAEDELQWEHIPGDEMMDATALETLRHAPVTHLHPPEFINAGTIELDAAGLTGGEIDLDKVEVEEGQEKRLLRIRLIVFDQALIEEIMTGRKQISTGRKVDLVPESGTFQGQQYDAIQRNFRFNHVAVLDEGRCGPMCSIKDGNDRQVNDAVQIVTPDTLDLDTQDVIRQEGDQWCIFSESGEKLECRATHEEAQNRLQEIEFFKNQDHDVLETAVSEDRDLQEVMDAAFTELVTSQIDNMQRERDEVLESIAQLANRQVREVEAQIAGSVMPVEAVLRAISQVVGIKMDRMKENLPNVMDGLRKALELTDNEEPETSDSTTKEVRDMAIEVEVGDSKLKIDLEDSLSELECEECQEVAGQIEDDVRTVIDAMQKKIQRQQGRIDQLESADDSSEPDPDADGEGVEDQPEPGQPQPSQPEQGGMDQEQVNKLVNLVNLIREEQPDYELGDKSLMQVMMDALEILGDIDVENVFGSPNAEDADVSREYLEGRVEQVRDQYQQSLEASDRGPVQPNGTEKDGAETEDIEEEIRDNYEKLNNVR